VWDNYQITYLATFCRDNNGLYLGASAVVFNGITDPATLETLACQEALALAEDLNLDRAFIVSDCKTTIDDIRDGTLGRNGLIIREIRSRSTHLRECSFTFESRASNFEAHNLARHMISWGVGNHLWLVVPYFDTIPVNILD
jgi:hypothetical protein